MSKVDNDGVISAARKNSPHPSVGLDCGPELIQNYDFAYNPELRDLEVVKTDIEDREEYIQSFAKETGVYNIMRMYAKTGDMSLLNRSEGFYGDISDLPVDELNPAAQQAAAEKAVAGLGQTLGIQGLTIEDFAAMSDAELADLINKAVQAKAGKVQSEEGGAE